MVRLEDRIIHEKKLRGNNPKCFQLYEGQLFYFWLALMGRVKVEKIGNQFNKLMAGGSSQRCLAEKTF